MGVPSGTIVDSTATALPSCSRSLVAPYDAPVGHDATGDRDSPTTGASTRAAAWVDVAPSAAVGARQVIAAHVGGRDLVLWRAVHGRLGVVDRQCPHLQADLASDGVVDADELVCGSHFWRIDLDGFVCKQNVLGRRDPKGRVEVIDCREVEGRIQVRAPADP
jgi:nitrite reductase/ring-hydroxylating ferredoxin subunit